MPPKNKCRVDDTDSSPQQLPQKTATLGEYLAVTPALAESASSMVATPSAAAALSGATSTLSFATVAASMANENAPPVASAAATTGLLARSSALIARPPSAAPPSAPRGPRSQLPLNPPRIPPNSIALAARRQLGPWSNARIVYPALHEAVRMPNITAGGTSGSQWHSSSQSVVSHNSSNTTSSIPQAPTPTPSPIPRPAGCHSRPSLISSTSTPKSESNRSTPPIFTQHLAVKKDLCPVLSYNSGPSRRPENAPKRSQGVVSRPYQQRMLPRISTPSFSIPNSPTSTNSISEQALRSLFLPGSFATLSFPQQQQQLHAHPSNMSSSTSSNTYFSANSSFSSEIQPHPQHRTQSRFAAVMASRSSASDPNAIPTTPLQETQDIAAQSDAQLATNVVNFSNHSEDREYAYPASGNHQGGSHGQMQAHPAAGNDIGEGPVLTQGLDQQAYVQQPQFGSMSRPASRASTAQSFMTASTSYSKAPAAPPGLSKPERVPLWQLNLTPSTRVRQPLPTALGAALDAADLARGQKLPSVLEPKMSQMEISYPDAIAYLLSTLNSGSPQVAALSETQQLRDRAVDVTFYDPSGTYLIPVRELILRNTTSLSLLVMELQSFLDQNINRWNQMSERGKELNQYLVSSIQVRWYSDPGFLSFPKVCGTLGGAGASAGNGAEYVQWPCDGGEMEMYWNTYRRVVQIGAVGNGPQAIAKPMFKVRTVSKLQSKFDHMLMGGGHVFINPPPPASHEQQVRMQTSVAQEKSKKPKTRADLSIEDQELVDRIVGFYSSKGGATDVSKAELVSAVLNVHSAREAANRENGAFEEYRGNNQSDRIFNSYGHDSGNFRVDGGLPGSDNPVDPKRNWGYYQRMGGNPEVHKRFDLSKSQAPFEEKDMPPPGYFDHLHDPKSIPSAEDMVPYMEIDPSVYDIPILSPNAQMRVDKYREEKERAISFDDDDDDEFFPAANGKAKVYSAPVISPSPVNPAKRHLRLDVDSIMNSVNSRKSIQNNQFSNFGSLNRPMSPSPLQNITNANTVAGSFMNNMVTQSAGPGFHVMSYAGEEVQPSDYEQMLNAASSQAASYYDNITDSNMVQNPYAMGNNARNNAGTTLGNDKLRGVNKPPMSSLSSFKDLLATKNSTMSSFGSSNQAGSGEAKNSAATYSSPGSSTASLANYHAQRGPGNGNRPGFARPRVGSQLRGESPAFKMIPKGARTGSPSNSLGSTLASGLQKMNLTNLPGQGSESIPKAASDKQ